MFSSSLWPNHTRRQYPHKTLPLAADDSPFLSPPAILQEFFFIISLKVIVANRPIQAEPTTGVSNGRRFVFGEQFNQFIEKVDNLMWFGTTRRNPKWRTFSRHFSSRETLFLWVLLILFSSFFVIVIFVLIWFFMNLGFESIYR